MPKSESIVFSFQWMVITVCCVFLVFGIDRVGCSTTILIGVFVWFVTALKGSF